MFFEKKRGKEKASEEEKSSTIWILADGQTPVKKKVWLGVTDGRYIEVKKGEVRAGDRVIVGTKGGGKGQEKGKFNIRIR